MSACLSDYSLASDSGVFDPPTKRLEADLLPQQTSHSVTVKHKMYAYWDLCILKLRVSPRLESLPGFSQLW